jgi:hypothetical protein
MTSLAPIRPKVPSPPDGNAPSVLRGAVAVVLLDRDAHEFARGRPRSAASVAVDSNGTVS